MTPQDMDTAFICERSQSIPLSRHDCLQGRPAVERLAALQKWTRLLLFELLHTLSQVGIVLVCAALCKELCGLSAAEQKMQIMTACIRKSHEYPTLSPR